MKRILFLDGIGCNPDGLKPRFIRDCGYRVSTPQLPDLDFAAAVDMANQALEDTAPDVVVGYSRGGGVAMMLDDLLIFVIAMVTLQLKGISSKYTHWANLVGGILMLLIGILLILKPGWLMFG